MSSQRRAIYLLGKILPPSERRLVEEIRARGENPRAVVSSMQAARIVAIIDKMAADLAEARKGVQL